MSKTILLLLILQFINYAYSTNNLIKINNTKNDITNNMTNDIIFLIDTSPSVIKNTDCNHYKLIRDFTSDFVYNMSDYNIRYISYQYNIDSLKDFDFSYNNTFVYNKMKNYYFNINGPTLVWFGLNNIINTYKFENRNHNILLLLFTDGSTLNKQAALSLLNYYPFNTSNINIIIIKTLSEYKSNNIVFDIFKYDKNYDNNTISLKCNNFPSMVQFYNLKFFNNLFYLYTTSTTVSSITSDKLITSRANYNLSTTDKSITTTANYNLSTTDKSITIANITSIPLTNLIFSTTTYTNSLKKYKSNTTISYVNNSNIKYIYIYINYYYLIIIILLILIFVLTIFFLKRYYKLKVNENIKKNINQTKNDRYYVNQIYESNNITRINENYDSIDNI